MLDQLEPLDIYRRKLLDKKKREASKSQMDTHLLNVENNRYQQSVSSSRDNYMVDALKKVRQSNVTHDENLTAFNGTWLHNQAIKK